MTHLYPVVKVVLWSRGAHLTKPGWSKPHTHSNPTNLALFRHKITLYRFSQGWLILLQGAQMGAGGGWAPAGPLSLTTVYTWVSSGFAKLSTVFRVSITDRRKDRDFRNFHSLTLPPDEPEGFLSFFSCRSNSLCNARIFFFHTTATKKHWVIVIYKIR